MTDRAVFDTNVWISGMLWRGAPHRCVLMAKCGVVQPVFCLEMLDELLRKLRDTFRFSSSDLRLVEDLVHEVGELIEIEGNLDLIEKDPSDDKFIECAIRGNVSVIVSGDKHLIEHDGYKGIRILSPGEFLDTLRFE